MDRLLGAVTAGVVLVVTLTANVELTIGWARGWAAEATTLAYLVALVLVVVRPNAPTAHAAAAAGAFLFWGGRVWALLAAHVDGPRDLRAAAATHFLAFAVLMGHHYRANRRIGLRRVAGVGA